MINVNECRGFSPATCGRVLGEEGVRAASGPAKRKCDHALFPRRSSFIIHRSSFVIALCVLLGAGIVRAADEADLDWDAWEQVPVLHDGRTKPLDSFARAVVREICGRQSPRLSLSGALAEGENDAVLTEARAIFPGGGPRKFRASELLFSWIVEPEKWQRVPLVPASDEGLRTDVLRFPLRDAAGTRLRRASPRQMAAAIENARSDEDRTRLADPRFQDLLNAYGRYEYLVANLTTPQGPADRLIHQIERVTQSWDADLEGWWQQFFPRSESGKEAVESPSYAAIAAKELMRLIQIGQVSPGTVRAPAVGDPGFGGRAERPRGGAPP